MSSASLTARELCARLAIERPLLAAGIAAGLPVLAGQRRRFDPAAVRDWLLASGRAAPAAGGDEEIWVQTRQEVAEHFGIALETVQKWIGQGMPGERGRRGKRLGRFPLKAIAAWRDGRKSERESDGAAHSKNESQARLFAARAEQAELELARQRRELLDARETTHRWLRHIHEAKALLAQVVPKIVRRLPADLPVKTREAIRRDVRHLLDEAFRTLALALEDEEQT